MSAASRYNDFVPAGKGKNKLITNRAEWAGITLPRTDNDPRDKDTLIKTLIDLKGACIAAETANSELRKELRRGSLTLIHRGVRDKQVVEQPEVKARIFGKFAFKENSKPSTPYLSGAGRHTNVSPPCAENGADGSGPQRSPALVKLLSTDHLQFRDFPRAMLLQDVQLLTRYLQKLEAENKELKADRIRLNRQQQQVHSRVGGPSRPVSASSTRARGRAPSGLGQLDDDTEEALRLAALLEASNRPASVTTHDGAPSDRRQALESDAAKQAPAVTASTSPVPGVDGVALSSAGGHSAASPSGQHSIARVMYDVIIRTGTCRNAGTAAPVWMTVHGSLGSLPLVFLNGNARSGSVRTMSPVLVELELTSTARRQDLLASDAPLRDQVIKAIAQTMGVPAGNVVMNKLQSLPTQRGTLTQLNVVIHMGKDEQRGSQLVEALTANSEGLLKALERGNLPNPVLFRPPRLGDAGLFERGAVCHVQVISALGSLGLIDQVDIGHDGCNSEDAWFCEEVFVRPSHQLSGWTRFPCHQWLKASASSGAGAKTNLTASLDDHDLMDTLAKQLVTASSAGPHQLLSVYEITVTTGTVKGSGTTAQVWVDIVGTQSSIVNCKLENDERDFRTGTRCTFVLVDKSVGALQRLVFSHDNSGFSPAWLLKEVQVCVKQQHNVASHALHPEETQGMWGAQVNAWLSKEQGLQMTVPLLSDALESWQGGVQSGDGGRSTQDGAPPTDAFPQEFRCPLSGDVMKHPVVAADGYTYEREQMEARLRSFLLTSPVTNQPLADLKLVPNRLLETLIANF